MRTQGERNAEVRLSISCPSAEKTDSQIYRLKKTDLSFWLFGHRNALKDRTLTYFSTEKQKTNLKLLQIQKTKSC